MFGNLGKMMQLAGKLKTELPALQKKLEETTFTAEAGGGVVSATVTGKLRVQTVTIDPSVLADADAGMVEDLVTAAVAAAQDKAAQAAQEALNELTGGMDLGGMEGLFGGGM